MSGLSETEAWARAHAWVAAWNARDLDAVMEHYADDVRVCSPLVAQRLGHADGVLLGAKALRAYLARGMDNPALHFRLEDVRVGLNAMTVLYTRENRMRVADTLELGPDLKATRMTACYAGGAPDV